MLLAIYHVTDRNVDLVLSINIPMKAIPSLSSGSATQNVSSTELGSVSEERWPAARETLEAAALRIVDFKLFA